MKFLFALISALRILPPITHKEVNTKEGKYSRFKHHEPVTGA
jgi:hypothetical protein